MSARTYATARPELPPFHANLAAAIKRDWLDPPSNPSNAVFLRAYAFGYAAEVLPTSVRLLLVTLLTARRQRRPLSNVLSFLVRSWTAVLKKGFSRRGLALFFAVGFGGARWLDEVLRWPVWKAYLLVRRMRVSRRSDEERGAKFKVDTQIQQPSDKHSNTSRPTSQHSSLLPSRSACKPYQINTRFRQHPNCPLLPCQKGFTNLQTTSEEYIVQ